MAIRAGDMPDQPDNVVQPFLDMNVRLVASKAYIEKHGMPASEANLRNHRFVGHDSEANRAPFNKWLRATVGDARIIYQATDERNMVDAILAGAGIGFVSDFDMTEDCDLVEVIPQRADWGAKLWLVTHVDLHRTSKVQAILTHLKGFAKDYAA